MALLENMFKKFVIIGSINTQTCSMTIFNKNKFDNEKKDIGYYSWYSFIDTCMSGNITLKYKKEIIDDIISNVNYICEVEIDNGTLHKVISIMEKDDYFKPEKYGIGIETAIQTEPLSKNLKEILEIINNKGTIKDDILYAILEEEYKIPKSNAARMIATLMRDGTIFSPKPGVYRVTPQ